MEIDNRPQTEENIVQVDRSSNQRGNRRTFFNGLITGVLLSAIIVGSIFIGRNIFYLAKVQDTKAETGSEEAAKSIISTDTLQKMKTIEEMIDQKYYGEEVTAEELQDGIYRGMVAALNDPYSEYYSEEELEETINGIQGVSYGIGAYISLDQTMSLPVISGVMDEAPAQKAGLREGDIIYEVDGESTKGYSLTQVVSKVKGKENTTVHLTIYREGEPDLLEIDIVRSKQLETETVESGMLEDTDGIGYLRIREFDNVTPDQFNEAMAELNAAEMKGLILDLRSNPGGDLAAVVEVCRRILPEGLVVYTEDKYGERKEYICDGEHELQIPLVVLVNEYSASASEILAGAIKDYNKGTLIGTVTYGKGIVQSINQLADGTALKLTVSAYFTPSGKNIHGTGIEPDIELEYDYEMAQDEGVDNQVEKAIEVLEGKISE